MSSYKIALIAGGFTIIGSLIGGWIGYRNALRIYNVSECNKASALFQTAFLPEIIFIKHNANIGNIGGSNRLDEILFHGYVYRHLKALEVFRSYLSSKERVGIDRAWQKYCCRSDNPKILHFEQYSEKGMKKVALERIEAIIKFAGHK